MILLSATSRDVWAGLRAQPGRTGLSFFSMAIGMGALTVVLALLGGLQQKSRQMVQDLGINVFAVVRGQSQQAGQTAPVPLAERHMAYLAANLPACSVTALRRFTAAGESTFAIAGVDDQLLAVRPWRVVGGRFFDPEDLRTRMRYAVTTRALAEQQRWSLGRPLSLAGTPFMLIGLIDTRSDALPATTPVPGLSPGAGVVMIPRSVLPVWQRSGPQPEHELDAIYVRTAAAASFEETVRKAQGLLQHPDYAARPIEWVTPDQLVEEVRRLQRVIALSGGSIAILCLVLGGTTLMSLMLANVRERIPEIGLRRALGASPAEVSVLFVSEACVVTLAAAVLGAGTAWVFLRLARETFPAPLDLGAVTALTPVSAALVLGILFSYWPARAAATITPMEALRNE